MSMRVRAALVLPVLTVTAVSALSQGMTVAIPAGKTLVGVPHTPGTREYLACEAGHLVLTASGERFELDPGDVAVFRGDQKHAYSAGDEPVVAYSVVVLAPG